MSAPQEVIGGSAVLLELGAMLVVLGVIARAATHVGLSAIPFYLLAGLALGNGGVVPLSFSSDFIRVGAEIGVVLLMFMVGLEYTAEELATNLRTGVPAGVMNFVLNFTPGVLAGLLFGFGPVGSLLLGGVTYNTSTGVMARILTELNRLGNRETPAVLSISVMEDLAMAVYLPVIAILLVGGGAATGAGSVVLAIGAVGIILFVAHRYGTRLSGAIASRTDEITLLTIFGLVLLVAGAADHVQISAAVGAFLLGLGLTGELADHTRRLLGPLRDLFAAMFFLFFGLQIDPALVGPVAVPAFLLAVFTAGTKMYTGWWAAARIGVGPRGRIRAGTALVPRGEFSILLAGLAVSAGLDPSIGALSATYVLILAIGAPLLARIADPLAARWLTPAAPPRRDLQEHRVPLAAPAEVGTASDDG